MTDNTIQSAALRPTLTDWGPQLLVALGAAMAFACFALEYLKEAPYFSFKQMAVIAVGCAVMIAGSAWQVARGQRSLREFARFWTVAAGVALMAATFAIYQLESRAFCTFIAPLTVFGFIVNHHLPASARQFFFVLLSVIALVGVFGSASAPAALGLAGAGLILIGICHLPIPLWVRVALLLACGAFLAALRSGWLYAGWIATALPVLASIFMFRIAVYLYDITNGKGPKTFWGRVGYFFMFPNLVFPFFPVVDSAAFGRTYYNEEALKIYERGASYIFRGLIHLLLYRAVYHHLVLAPEQVHDAASFLHYIVANFALYLRISGLFHLIVGLLVLFGYNLPETHTRFYFSNSFTDFWRRINIYWKDFMQKMVFNPSYMRFKNAGLPHLTSLTLSMAVVFFLTWALHAYQWFWLTGTHLFTLPDILFWTILAICLITQTVLEARPKKRSLAGFLGPRAFLVLRTVSTFLIICLLWSFWTSEKATDWLALVARSGLTPALSDVSGASFADWAVTAASIALTLFMTAITMGISFGLPKATAPAPRRAARTQASRAPSQQWALAGGAAVLLALFAVKTPAITESLGPQAQGVLESMGSPRLNRADNALATRGYYEDLAGGDRAGRFNPELWDVFANQETIDRSERNVEYRDDYLWRYLIPNTPAKFSDLPTPYPVNRWGFADQHYELAPAPGVYRITMLGASREMGWGVGYEHRFETLLEDHLNRDPLAASTRYEILNFSIRSYSPVQRLMALEQHALPFNAHALMYGAGKIDMWWDHHARMVRAGVAMPYPFLDEVNRRAGVDASMSEAEIIRRLEPFTEEVVLTVYRRITAIAQANDMTPVWFHVPDTDDRAADIERLERLAQEAGFITLRLSPHFDPNLYAQSQVDTHPNIEGNRLLAAILHSRLSALDHQGAINFAARTAPEGEGEARTLLE